MSRSLHACACGFNSAKSGKMINIIWKKLVDTQIVLLFAVGLACSVSSQALAQDCSNLSENEAWNKGMSSLQYLYNKGEYDNAIETAKGLFGICADSPALLYYTGLSLEEKGENERALIYYQKASENMTQMSTEPGISRKIWYKRYEMEHPERTEKAVAAQASLIEAQAKQIEEQKALIEQNPLENQEQLRTWMWTGVGIGGAGIAFLATGAALLAADKKPLNDDLKENPKRSAGWALLGTGLGLAVAGGVMAGISGYQYSKAKEDAVMSVSVSPMGASFYMTF